MVAKFSGSGEARRKHTEAGGPLHRGAEARKVRSHYPRERETQERRLSWGTCKVRLWPTGFLTENHAGRAPAEKIRKESPTIEECGGSDRFS